MSENNFLQIRKDWFVTEKLQTLNRLKEKKQIRQTAGKENWEKPGNCSYWCEHERYTCISEVAARAKGETLKIVKQQNED